MSTYWIVLFWFQYPEYNFYTGRNSSTKKPALQEPKVQRCVKEGLFISLATLSAFLNMAHYVIVMSPA
jgi:hypothetical protein